MSLINISLTEIVADSSGGGTPVWSDICNYDMIENKSMVVLSKTAHITINYCTVQYLTNVQYSIKMYIHIL